MLIIKSSGNRIKSVLHLQRFYSLIHMYGYHTIHQQHFLLLLNICIILGKYKVQLAYQLKVTLKVLIKAHK